LGGEARVQWWLKRHGFMVIDVLVLKTFSDGFMLDLL
jgi:hypothetical protein